MIYGIYTSMAGTRVSEKKLANAAGNIANSTMDRYKRTEAILLEDKTGFPDVNILPDPAPGAITEESDGLQRETSNVDLCREMPEMMIAKRAYEANLKALETQDQVLASVLDIFA